MIPPTEFGLGALPSPPDARDFPIVLDTATVLPRRYLSVRMPPVLNQNIHPKGEDLGTCVAHACDGVKTRQEILDGHGVLPFDPFWLYHRAQAIDGIPGVHEGTTIRAALRVMKGTGFALKGKPETAGNSKIAVYYAVPFTEDAIKRAIFQHGPVLIATLWYGNWFHPAQGRLPAPTGSPIGGHARYAWGWDDDVASGSVLVRNSWASRWGINGSSYDPWRYLLPAMHDAWRSSDVLGD